MKKRSINWRPVTICLALVFSIAGGMYVIDRTEKSVAVLGQPQNDVIFILDAGHGGMDGGCSAADGTTEKGINLDIVLTVRDMCRLFGYEVYTTRDKDVSIHDRGVTGVGNQKRSDMDNRLALFNKYDNAVCISIHQNLFTDPAYSGAQMFFSQSHPRNEEFAGIMQQRFRTMLQPDNARETKLCGKELFLCYFCSNPTLMVECGFLSNPDEAAKLSTDEYRKQIALTVFSGMNDYLLNGSSQ